MNFCDIRISNQLPHDLNSTQSSLAIVISMQKTIFLNENNKSFVYKLTQI